VYTLQENLLLSDLIKGLVFSDCVAVYGNMFMLCCGLSTICLQLGRTRSYELRAKLPSATCLIVSLSSWVTEVLFVTTVLRLFHHFNLYAILSMLVVV